MMYIQNGMKYPSVGSNSVGDDINRRIWPYLMYVYQIKVINVFKPHKRV
jgi:hypothetical protein